MVLCSAVVRLAGVHEIGPLVFHIVLETYCPLKSSKMTLEETVTPAGGLPLATTQSSFTGALFARLNSVMPKLQVCFSSLVVEAADLLSAVFVQATNSSRQAARRFFTGYKFSVLKD